MAAQPPFDLLRPLAAELKALGAEDVTLTHYGAVLATIPATIPARVPTVAFLAHVDLGADDKAGAAIVMTMARHLLRHRDLPHGRIRIGLTPDQEIGGSGPRGLPADLKADVAYTLDGAELGELVYETFSADKADVEILGASPHPDEPSDTLVNALHLAAKIVEAMHVALTHQTTAGRDGFIHLYRMGGHAAAATLHFLLRDVEVEGLRDRGALIEQVCAVVQGMEPRARITCCITPQYRNMRYWLQEDMRPVDLAREACRQLRFAHGSTPDCVSVPDMTRATEACIRLSELWGGVPMAEPVPAPSGVGGGGDDGFSRFGGMATAILRQMRETRVRHGEPRCEPRDGPTGLGPRDRLPEPVHRVAIAEPATDRPRSSRGDRPLHATVLAQHDRPAAGRDGRALRHAAL
jgi:hypothetical protein